MRTFSGNLDWFAGFSHFGDHLCFWARFRGSKRYEREPTADVLTIYETFLVPRLFDLGRSIDSLFRTSLPTPLGHIKRENLTLVGMAPVRPPGDKDVFADPVSSVVRYLHADRANYLSNRDGKLYFFPPVPSVTEVYRGKRNRFHARRVYCAGFVRPKHETPEEKRARRRIRDRRQAELEYVTINDHRVDPIHSDVLRSGNRLYWRSNYTIKTISPGDLEPRTIATRASSQVWDFDISPDGRVLAVCYRKFGDLNTLLESRISVALYKLHSDGTLGENTAEFAIAGSYCRFSPDGLTLAIISRYEGWPTKKENTEITIIDME